MTGYTDEESVHWAGSALAREYDVASSEKLEDITCEGCRNQMQQMNELAASPESRDSR